MSAVGSAPAGRSGRTGRSTRADEDALLSPADLERRRGLRRMKAVALGGLLFMAALFVVGFATQDDIPAMAYVRAAGEGGMVGALADWFAVTALFRHPLGLPIPHTAIIPRRKDEIGRSLSDFVEQNFLEPGLVREKILAVGVAQKAGTWLQDEEHAERVASEASALAAGVLRALEDDDVRDVIGDLAQRGLVDPSWAPSVGAWLERLIDADAHRGAVDLAADSLASWLHANRSSFAGLVSRRLPSWVPSIAHRLIDDTAYREAIAFVEAVRADPDHRARRALDAYARRLALALQEDPDMIARFESTKGEIFNSPRVRELAGRAWESAKAGLLRALEDEDSGLRTRAREGVQTFGARLENDEALGARVDAGTSEAAGHIVTRYRHDIASIIDETVASWDAHETTRKLELLVGKDLQFIRLNGTIVGALAGVAIYTVAHALFGA